MENDGRREKTLILTSNMENDGRREKKREIELGTTVGTRCNSCNSALKSQRAAACNFVLDGGEGEQTLLSLSRTNFLNCTTRLLIASGEVPFWDRSRSGGEIFSSDGGGDFFQRSHCGGGGDFFQRRQTNMMRRNSTAGLRDC